MIEKSALGKERQEFKTRVIEPHKLWMPVNDIIPFINGRAQGEKFNRRQNEYIESAIFALALQTWEDSPINITFVDEENTNYKGIDFFLKRCAQPTDEKSKVIAFQLLEHHEQYSGKMSAKEIVEWIKTKKGLKSDKKVSLVVSLKPVTELAVPLNYLYDELKGLGFMRVILMGDLKKDNGGKANQKILIVIPDKIRAVVDFENLKLVEADSGSPFFVTKTGNITT